MVTQQLSACFYKNKDLIQVFISGGKIHFVSKPNQLTKAQFAEALILMNGLVGWVEVKANLRDCL